MRENFKIEKELLFKNNIKEITSISLDSDYKFDNDQIVGNFIVSGDYRIHEVSINREKFNFKIPFKHNIAKDIDNDTLKLEITDFVYDYKKDDLMVNIEYEIIGERKDILIFENEETLDDFLNKREVEVIDTRIDEIKNKLNEELNTEKDENINKTEKIINKVKDEVDNNEFRFVKKDIIIEKKPEDNKIEEFDIEDRINKNLNSENRDSIQTEEIINNVSTIQDKFITYKIYKVKENDTLESILLNFHSNIEELKEYNELNNINVGDKIIIPIDE